MASNNNIKRNGSSNSNCCARFRWEFREVSFFGLNEPNGTTLDVKNSFAPEGRWRTFARVAFLLWNFATLVMNLIIYPEENLFIFLGYLTHVTWVMCLAYQMVVVFLSTRCTPTQPPSKATPGFLVKLTWILYSIAAPGSLAVIILYWSMDYDGETITYYNVMKHGIVGLMIFIDGLFLALIPVRLKHFLVFFLYGVVYLMWSYTHSFLEIGNGTFEDDALYDVLKWNENPVNAFVLSVVVVFLLLPACYLVTWMVSLGWMCNGARRPTLQGSASKQPSNNYVSMGEV